MTKVFEAMRDEKYYHKTPMPGKLCIYLTSKINDREQDTNDSITSSHMVQLFECLEQEVSSSLDQLVCNVIAKVLNPPERKPRNLHGYLLNQGEHSSVNPEVSKALEDLLQRVCQGSQFAELQDSALSATDCHTQIKEAMESILEDIILQECAGPSLQAGVQEFPPLSPTSVEVGHSICALVECLEQEKRKEDMIFNEAQSRADSIGRNAEGMSRAPNQMSEQQANDAPKGGKKAGQKVFDARDWIHPDLFTSSADIQISKHEESLLEGKEGAFLLI